MAYTAPKWQNDAPPAINAAAMQEISDNLEYVSKYLTNENLIVNGDFRPSVRVNQRGQAVYTGTAVGFDMWRGTNRSVRVTLTSTGLTIASTDSSALPFYRQKLETYDDLLGQTVTLSGITGGGTLHTATSTLPELPPASGIGYCNILNVFDLWLDSSGMYVRLKSSVGGTIAFRAVKLELGDKQTLAHQDADGNWILNDEGNYAAMLLRCQRYLQLYATETLRPSKAADCRPVMRVNPSQTTVAIDGTTYYVNTAEM